MSDIRGHPISKRLSRAEIISHSGNWGCDLASKRVFATDRVRKAQSLGAGAYVRKPYLSETLGLAVRRELDRTA